MPYAVISKRSMKQVGGRTFGTDRAAKGFRIAQYGKDAVHYAVIKVKN